MLAYREVLLLFPTQVLTWSGSADPELTVSAQLGTPTRKTAQACWHTEKIYSCSLRRF